jgi:hypothetical protein
LRSAGNGESGKNSDQSECSKPRLWHQIVSKTLHFITLSPSLQRALPLTRAGGSYPAGSGAVIQSFEVLIQPSSTIVRLVSRVKASPKKREKPECDAVYITAISIVPLSMSKRRWLPVARLCRLPGC